jgi:hypothetical protein
MYVEMQQWEQHMAGIQQAEIYVQSVQSINEKVV